MGEVQDARDGKKVFVAPAIKSFEHYDFSRAKICCSLTWLVAKAYGTGKCITGLPLYLKSTSLYVSWLFNIPMSNIMYYIENTVYKLNFTIWRHRRY